MSVEDNERDLLNPAIKGTEGILTAIQKYNPKVKRVVIISSFASIVNIDKGRWPEHTYSEADWNPVTYETAKNTDNGAVSYCASKVFAEKAAWDFVEKNKPNFSITTICPPMVYGPVEHVVDSMDKLNTSSADIYRLMNGSEKTVPETSFLAFVDVREVAEAHLRAYESEKAANQRYFCTAGNFTYQQCCDIIRAEVPEAKDKTPEGDPNAPFPAVYHVNNEKIQRDLGIHFRSLKETITDTARNLLQQEKLLGITR